MSQMRDMQFERLVRQAYTEGFTEGLRESTTFKGGKLWTESESYKKLSVLRDDCFPQERADG